MHAEYMRLALALAEKATRHGEPPFGALVVAPDGDVVADSTDRVVAEADMTWHAEVNVVRLASRALGPDLTGCTLYTTVEPCPMCFTSAWLARVSRVVFGCTMDAVDSVTLGQQRELRIPASEVNARSGEPIELLGGVLAEACLKLFEERADDR
jgi:tRNA(Arg) A34 adenosine deaminase TadA